MPDSTHIIITIARQLGAGGSVLGQRLASRLGFAYVDKDILRLASEKSGVSSEQLIQWDERASGLWDRLIDSFAIFPPDGFYAPVTTPPTIRDDRLFELESRVIRETAARRSAVIIGHAGFWTLRDDPAIIRIFLHSPPQVRVATVREAFKLTSDADARAMIDKVDAERTKFTEAMTKRSLTDARNFDLTINTQTVQLATAEEIVMKMVEQIKT